MFSVYPLGSDGSSAIKRLQSTCALRLQNKASPPPPFLSFNHMHMGEDNVQQLRNEAEDQSLDDHSEMLRKITDVETEQMHFNSGCGL